MFDPEGDGDPTSELGGQRPEVLSTRLPTKTFQAAPHVDGPKLVIELRQRIEPIEAHPSVSGGRFAKHRRMLAELRAGERDEMRTAEDLVRVWILRHPQYNFVNQLVGFMRKPDLLAVVDVDKILQDVPAETRDRIAKYVALADELRLDYENTEKAFLRDYGQLRELMRELRRHVEGDEQSAHRIEGLTALAGLDKQIAELRRQHARDLFIFSLGSLAQNIEPVRDDDEDVQSIVRQFERDAGVPAADRTASSVLNQVAYAGAPGGSTVALGKFVEDVRGRAGQGYPAFERARDALERASVRDQLRGLDARRREILGNLGIGPADVEDELARRADAIRQYHAEANTLLDRLYVHRDELEQLAELRKEGNDFRHLQRDQLEPYADFERTPLPLRGEFGYAADAILQMQLALDRAHGRPAEWQARALFAYTTNPDTRGAFVAAMSVYLLQTRRANPSFWIPEAAGSSTRGAAMIAGGTLGQFRFDGTGIVRAVG